MNDAEAAALLAVMAAPTAQHKDVAEKHDVSKAITLATIKAVKAGLLRDRGPHPG